MFPNPTWAHENKGSIAVTPGKGDAKASRWSNKDALSDVLVRHKPSVNMESANQGMADHVQIPVRFTHPNTAAICQCKTQPQHGEGIHLPGCATGDMDH